MLLFLTQNFRSTENKTKNLFQVDSRAESVDKKIARLDVELKKYKDQVNHVKEIAFKCFSKKWHLVQFYGCCIIYLWNVPIYIELSPDFQVSLLHSFMKVWYE